MKVMWEKQNLFCLDECCMLNKIISSKGMFVLLFIFITTFGFNANLALQNKVTGSNTNSSISETKTTLNEEANNLLSLLPSDFEEKRNETDKDNNLKNEGLSDSLFEYNKTELIVINGEDMFEKLINENDYLILFFTAPWCGMSKRAVGQINEMIKYLDSIRKPLMDHSINLFLSKKISIGLISVPEYPNLSKKLNVSDYPTIKLVKRDTKYKIVDYYGNIHYRKVLCWLIQQINLFDSDNFVSNLIKINDVEGLHFFTGLNNNVIVYFDAKTSINVDSEYKLLSDIFKVYDNIIIGQVKINEFQKKSGPFDYDNKSLFYLKNEIDSFINSNNNTSFMLIFNSGKVVNMIKSPFKNENIILNKIDNHVNDNIIMLSSETIGEVLSKDEILLLMFNGNSHIDYNELKQEMPSTTSQFYNILKKVKAIRSEKMNNANSENYYNEKILYVISGNEGPTNRRFMDYLHIKDEMLPSVLIIKDLNVSPPKKYYLDLPKVHINNIGKVDSAPFIDKESETNWIVLDNDTSINFSPNIISDFIDEVNNGLVNNTYYSQSIPLKQNSPVYIVVGDSFKEIVHDSNKDVLVLFYTPWCGHCKTFEPIYNEVANIVSSKTNIIIAKIDMSSNFVPEEQIGGKIFRFPTIKLFKRRDKKNPIDFDGERETNTILDFIWIHTARDEL